MRLESIVAASAIGVVGFPACALVLNALFSAFGSGAARERAVRVVSPVALGLAQLSALAMTVAWVALGAPTMVVARAAWYELNGHSLPIALLVDATSVTMATLTAVIVGLVARFSRSYMHREPGFARFFLLLSTFAAGMSLLSLAGTFDVLIVGWELVGATSVLLIAFFHERPGPVLGATRAFITYRACDIGLLVGTILVHQTLGSTDITAASANAAHLSPGTLTLLALLFLLAAIGKSAQFPVMGWLPRAMEGPTPSSALFYGALAIHAGPLLLLRATPFFERSLTARVALVAVGAATAVLGTLTGRVQSDIKNGLAYASATQVGVIFVEIALGWHRLALAHVVGHAFLRSFQLLRAPTALHDAHRVLSDAGSHHAPTGAHYERALPEALRARLYGLSLEGFHLEALLERFVTAPVLALARALDRVDRRAAHVLGVPVSAPVDDQAAPSQSPREEATR